MLESRSIRDLCCITQATLFNVCVTERDLRTLGAWDPRPSERGFSSGVWCRAFLHKAVQRDEATARRVSDLLDLHHLDTVAHVRATQPCSLEAWIDTWIAEPDGETLPGYLWALCTDTRDSVAGLGARLCHEAVTAALQGLVAGTVEADEPG